jgi:hypothetical protein
MQFRKKPVVIHAMEVPKGVEHPEDDAEDFLRFMGLAERNIAWTRNWRSGLMRIVTLEGSMSAQPGDWIVKGIKGELYPVKPDIFKATYEPVSASPEEP